MTDVVFSWSGAVSLFTSSQWLQIRIAGKPISGRTVTKARYQMRVRALSGDASAPCSVWLETENGVIVADPFAPVSSESDPEYPSAWVINTYEGEFQFSGEDPSELFSGQSELKIANPLVSGFTQGLAVLLEINVYVTASDVWGAAIYDAGGWTPCTVFLYDGVVWHKQALSYFNGIDW